MTLLKVVEKWLNATFTSTTGTSKCISVILTFI